jgi:hypothetical protein
MLSGLANIKATFSGYSFAIFLGTISPKVITKIETITVAMTAPLDPKLSLITNKYVTSDEALMFTKLFRINTLARRLGNSLINLKTNLAISASSLRPLAICLTLILFKAEKAVSVAEIMADKISKTIKIAKPIKKSGANKLVIMIPNN